MYWGFAFAFAFFLFCWCDDKVRVCGYINRSMKDPRRSLLAFNLTLHTS
jgi:hypothetical protein